MIHCQMLQAGEIQAIVGDAERDGAGGRQYCGLWSLTSRHRVMNVFGNSYAGLLPSDIRSKSPILECIDDYTCLLSRKADENYPVDVKATYTIYEPYYIDHTLVFCDRSDIRNIKGFGRFSIPQKKITFREVSWCSYMNSLDDPRIHFLSAGNWFRYISLKHGIGSNIVPSFISDDELEVWPDLGEPRPFYIDRISERFDEAFFYGRIGDMVLIFVFDKPRWLRFFCSPTGGEGLGILAGKSYTAWDFEWIIPEQYYQINREYSFRMRLVYKKFISDADVLEEYYKAQKHLGYRNKDESDIVY